MTIDCDATVSNCGTRVSCRINFRPNKPIKSFAALTSWKFIATDMLREFETVLQKSQYFLVLYDLFVTLVSTNPLRVFKVKCEIKAIVSHLDMVYSSPGILLLEDGNQLTSRLLGYVIKSLSIWNELKTTSHSQNNHQVARYSRKIIVRLPHYLFELHLKDSFFFQTRTHLWVQHSDL